MTRIDVLRHVAEALDAEIADPPAFGVVKIELIFRDSEPVRLEVSKHRSHLLVGNAR